jgi:hypothetical protein
VKEHYLEVCDWKLLNSFANLFSKPEAPIELECFVENHCF